MVRFSVKMLLLATSCALPWESRGFTPKTFVIRDMAGLHSYLFHGPGGGGGSVYRTIKKKFDHNYERIGAQEIGKWDGEGGPSLQAGINHIGMVYNSGFADFSVYLKREVAPDLFDDERYIVIDNFEIHVDAQKLLNNLKGANLIDMTKRQYDAYKNIGFKRSYRYIHFADSFEDALNLNLNKLFFTFEVLQDNNYLKMKPYEFISREDSFSIETGGRASGHPANLTSVEFGGFVEFERFSKLEIQAVGPEDRSFKNEKFRISFEKEKGKNVMGYSALNVDFLNILRLTLFQHEFNHRYMDSYRINLGFQEKDIGEIENEDSLIGNVVQNIILAGGRGNIEILKPYLVSKEYRREERRSSRYSLLLRGKSKECQTSEVKIVKDNKVNRFFRHTFEQIEYKTNLVSKLFSSILRTFLRLDGFAQEARDTFYGRRICIEYKNPKNLMDNKKSLVFAEEDEKLSLKFEATYYVHNPKGKIKDRCVEILRNCPGVPPEVIDDVKKGKIKSDLKIHINYVLSKNAINHFNSLSISDVYDAIHILCTRAKKRDKAGRVTKYGKISKKCERELQEYYDRYYKEMIAHNYSWEDYEKCDRYVDKYAKNHLNWAVLVEICIHRSSLKKLSPLECSLPLWHFRNLVDKISEHTNKKEDIYAFFGIENVFFHGSLQGRTHKGNYKACFKDGNFSGTGLIDHFMRSEKMRPASLLILE